MSEPEKKPKPTLVEALAKVITKIYIERGISQEKLAKESNIARGTVIRLITIGSVTIPNLQRVCRTLGVQVSEVFRLAELERKNASR